MVEHYVLDRGPGKRAIVEFSVRTVTGDHVYQFVADPHGPSFHAGSREKANVTFMMRVPTFLRIVSGSLDGLVALAQGKIKLRGNLFLARKVQGWFDMRR
jgi:putative sterol carrier protein